VWFGEKLATAEMLIAKYPGAGWFFSDGAFRTLEGELRTSWFADWARVPDPYFGSPTAALLEVNFILTSSVMVRRDLLAATGGFDPGMSHAEDVDLWIRLARRAPAVATARSLVRYQHRPGGLTRQVIARLEGNARLYERLARETDLEPRLCDAARRRAGLSRIKLAQAALRDGDAITARRHLAHAWGSGRTTTVVAAWGLTLLPAPISAWLRAHPWVKGGIAAKALETRRVSLENERAAAPADAAAGSQPVGERVL
jgi:GT2 family glycosyltransferase